MIREVIVVEGKDDISAVRQAVKAELISTGGFGITERTVARIRAAQRRCGVIILTDPDHAGDQIRERIASMIGPCKHAHLTRDRCTRERDGNIGVENASPQAIRDALAQAHCQHAEPRSEFSAADLMAHGLTGAANASERRRRLGDALGIGDANARRMIRRLNHYGVTREEFDAAIHALESSP